MRLTIPFIVLAAVAILTFGAFTTYYYEGFLRQENVTFPEVESITAPRHVEGSYGEVFKIRGGRVVFDNAHENAFSVSEISTLLEKLTTLGVGYEFADTPEDLKHSLKYTDALVIISPQTPYSSDEVSNVMDFSRKGGRLAFFTDPTRGSRINSISSQMGVVFAEDYLYNINENAGNYRHVFIDDFRSSPIAAGLKRVTFFTASSIVSDGGIAFTDSKTMSSFRGEGPHSTINLVGDSILAVADQSFIEQSFDRFDDNGRLISNIADFLGNGRRRYTLEDFPAFYSDVTIKYSNTSLLEEALAIKGALVEAGIKSSISQEESDETIFIGFFNESKVELEELGEIIADKTIVVGGFEFDIESTAIIYLKGKKIWILSQEEDSINNLISVIREGRLKFNLATENMGILLYEAAVIPETSEDGDGAIEDGGLNETL